MVERVRGVCVGVVGYTGRGCWIPCCGDSIALLRLESVHVMIDGPQNESCGTWTAPAHAMVTVRAPVTGN